MRRSGSGRVGLHPALEARLRRVDPTALCIPEIRVVTSQAIKQTPDDWLAADDPAPFAILDNGVVRLDDGVDVLVAHAYPTGTPANFTDLEEQTLGGPANGASQYTMVHVHWTGPELAETELLRATFRLHPRLSGAQSKEVVFWRLRLYAVVTVDHTIPPTGATGPAIQLVPLVDPLDVLATGEAAGDVTFDYSALPIRPKPIGFPVTETFLSRYGGTMHNRDPITLCRITAHKANGDPAANTGLGYNSAAASAGGGPVLSAHDVRNSTYFVGTHKLQSWLGDEGPIGGTPYASFETGAYVSDDLEFTHPGDWLDLNGEIDNENAAPDDLGDAASYQLFQATASLNATTAPDGTSAADKLVESTANNNHQFTSPRPSTSDGYRIGLGEVVRLETCLKAAGRTKAIVRATFNGTGFYAKINLSTGAVEASGGAAGGSGTGTLDSVVVTPVPNGFYHIALEGTVGTSLRVFLVVRMLGPADAESYTGDGASGLYAWRTSLRRSPVALPSDLALSIRGGVPVGTTLQGQIRNDADSAWVDFRDGQQFVAATPDGLPGLGLTPTVVRKVRVRFLTDAGSARTPALTYLALEDVATVDLSRVAEVESYSSGVDVVECKGEIAQVRVRALRDGAGLVPDFRSTIEDVLSTYFLPQMTLRLWIGDRALPRDQWLHKGDYDCVDFDPQAAEITLVGLSPLGLVRDLLPPYSPGESLMPADENSNPDGWTDEGGAVSELEESIQTDEQTRFVQSVAAPTTDVLKFRMAPPKQDTTGRRHIVEYRYRKDASGGMTVTVKFRWKQGTTAVADSGLLTCGADWEGGSFELEPEEVAQLSDPTDWQLEIEASNSGGAPNRRVQVCFAQFRLGGRREKVSYEPGQTRKAVYDDLIQNRLEIPARYIGPGVTDVVTVVGKEVSPATSRLFEKENLTAKTDVDAICMIGGEVLTDSQGRLTVIDLFGPKSVVMQFPASEIRMLSTSPGFEWAIPDYFARYDWNAGRGGFEAEARGLSGIADRIPRQRLMGPKILDDEVGKWIQNEALAKTIAERMVTHFGPGYLAWEFETTMPYPELEEGDLVLLPVEQFVGKDPVTARALRGRLMVRAVIRQCMDAMGYRFGVWVRSHSDMMGQAGDAGVVGVKLPVVPREVVIGHARFVRQIPDLGWDRTPESYAIPINTATSHPEIAHLSPSELPQDAELVAFDTRYYLGDAGGGTSGITSGLYALPHDGGAAIKLARGSDTTEQNVWLTTGTSDMPFPDYPLDTSHRVDWTQFSYAVIVGFFGTTTTENARFQWVRLTWR